MRDIDCKKYSECLDSAAKSNSALDCEKCKRHDMAVELGRVGGLKGGPARAAVLTKQERVRIARKAANTRWGIELLDCPFCHSTDLEFERNVTEMREFVVICNNKECGILGPLGAKSRKEAIKKWNG